MCKFFGVSRSGCYAFVHRLGRPEQDAALAEVIAKQRERSFRMNRDFHASKPNSKWVTDISYIHTRQGVLYLTMIRDLYDNSIVACKTGTEQTVNLVLDTIRLAMKQEKRKKPECCCIRAFYGGDGGNRTRVRKEVHESISGCSLSTTFPLCQAGKQADTLVAS